VSDVFQVSNMPGQTDTVSGQLLSLRGLFGLQAVVGTRPCVLFGWTNRSFEAVTRTRHWMDGGQITKFSQALTEPECGMTCAYAVSRRLIHHPSLC
jgi:hypothetical protein